MYSTKVQSELFNKKQIREIIRISKIANDEKFIEIQKEIDFIIVMIETLDKECTEHKQLTKLLLDKLQRLKNIL